MRPLLTPQEMGAADKRTIDAGTPAEILMERAGRAVARAAIRAAGGRYGKRAVVVCGKGSNGGDGFVAARALADEGLSVRCLWVEDLSSSSGAARAHLMRLPAAGVVLEPFSPERLRDADVVIDAIFGTGFHGPATGGPTAAIAAINAARATVVAIDIPSGVDGGTGLVEGAAVKAHLTVALAAEKLGSALSPGAAHAGRVEVVDIGIPIDEPPRGPWLVEDQDVAPELPIRAVDAHKRSAGSVALLGGSAGMSGALVLAARGATRMGAGYATTGTTAEVDPVVSQTLPEVLSVVVSDDDVLGAESLKRFSAVLERADALVIGPGLGVGPQQRALMEEVLATVEVPVVVDADALNVLVDDPTALTERKGATVITPHPAEMARVMACSTKEVQTNRLGTARIAAERFSCVVLLKGYRTIVASPDGRATVNPTGGPKLATAGTGDVLAGAIGALLAGGLDAFVAAWTGVYLHGLAGELVAEGGLAWEVAEELPRAASTVRGRSKP